MILDSLFPEVCKECIYLYQKSKSEDYSHPLKSCFLNSTCHHLKLFIFMCIAFLSHSFPLLIPFPNSLSLAINRCSIKNYLMSE